MKRNKSLLGFLLVIILLAFASPSYARDLPSPNRDFYVYDEANLLSSQAKERIIKVNQDLYEKTGAQIVIVTLNKLPENMDIEELGVNLFEKWKIGKENSNNGILLLISMEEKKYRLEVGYGLEGSIPDLVANEILNGMKEFFVKGEYQEGILYAFEKTLGRVEREYQVSINRQGIEARQGERSSSSPSLSSMLIRIILLIILFNLFFGGRGGRGSRRRYRGPFFFPGPFYGGPWGGSGGGFGGGGFGGGGNFGGGGRSGGGGASGGW